MIFKMNTTKHLARIASTTILVGVVVAALVACSGSSRVRKPSELVTVTNQFDMQPVW